MEGTVKKLNDRKWKFLFILTKKILKISDIQWYSKIFRRFLIAEKEFKCKKKVKFAKEF